MSRDKTKLIPELQDKLAQVESDCLKNGAPILVYFTERELSKQAIFYRQSRTTSQVNKAKDRLRLMGFGYLADVFDKTEPCNGQWVTNARPGESWHNIGEAFDAVPMLNGICQWKYKSAPELWDIYGEACKSAELEWGGTWRNKDLPHAQIIHPKSSPIKTYSPEELLEILKERGLI